MKKTILLFLGLGFFLLFPAQNRQIKGKIVDDTGSPLSSAAEALQGRLAGVQLVQTEGAPGADILVRVRGGGSITQDNSPLYIVDGVQVDNALSVIAPQDIASIDVLKDAA